MFLIKPRKRQNLGMGNTRGKAPYPMRRLLLRKAAPLLNTVNYERNTVVQKIHTILWIVRDARKMEPRRRLFSLRRESLSRNLTVGRIRRWRILSRKQ